MADSQQRKTIEEALQATIQNAQASVQSDPKMQAMVDQLRSLYREDREDFMFALGAAPPPPSSSPKRPPVPPSRIPQLLFLLNAVTTKGPVSAPPSFRNKSGVLPSSLNASTIEVVQPDAPEIENNVPTSPARRPSRIKELQEIDKLEAQIQKAQHELETIKLEETAIRERRGKYAVAIERLKAERLLRELPGTINNLTQKKKYLEDQIQGN